MLKSFRDSLRTTVYAGAPLLLTACGDPDPNQKTSLMVIALPLLWMTISLIKTLRVKSMGRLSSV